MIFPSLDFAFFVIEKSSMGGFNLPDDFHDDPEALLQRARASLIPPRRNLPLIHPNPRPTDPVHSENPK